MTINYQAQHEDLKKKVIMEISMRFTNIIAIPYDVGVARAFDNPKRVYKYGMDGVPDLFIIGPDARIRFADIKTGKSGLSKEQKAWKKTCIEVTGEDIVTEIRSVYGAVEYVMREFPNYSIRYGKG